MTAVHDRASIPSAGKAQNTSIQVVLEIAACVNHRSLLLTLGLKVPKSDRN